ncbi:COG complex component [Backusella circina FSU 941]|nr:COG complex component [Backusella circina FSU 941]
MTQRQSIFSFDDDDDDDDKVINSVQPLPRQAIERAAFTTKEFNPDAFLSSRRYLGLERLKSELNGHLKLLKTELVELINRDYQDFINLSTNLKGVDKEIEKLKLPLIQMETQVQDVRDHFQQVINSLEAQLDRRAHLRDKKSTLKLLLNIHESVTKVEDLLGINADINKETIKGEEKEEDEVIVVDDSLGKQIERVAIEFNQMQHLVGRGKELAFVTENEWRITRIRDTLQQKLSKTLTAALSHIQHGELSLATRESLTQCLRTYALIDQTQVAEQLIREQFVRPFLKKTITSKAVEGAKGYVSSPDGNKHPLTLMYTKILSFASVDLQPIMEITQRKLKGANYEILVNSLWLEVAERINKECKSIFAAGQTDIFHKNYSATVSFINGLESLCYSRKSLLYLRNHPIYSDFMKKWQLLVYFQLRFREIIGGVETSLNEIDISVPAKRVIDESQVVLSGSKAVLSAIAQCWSDHVFLYGLSHRFWKLTLQLVKRYKIWATAVMENMLDNEKNPTTKSTSSENGGDESITLQVLLAHDVTTLVNTIQSQTNDIILPKLPANAQDLLLLKESMSESLNELEQSTKNELNRHITTGISRRCMDSLKLVKSITSQYRHTNRHPPTESSYFVANIFKPFQQFIQQNQGLIKYDQIGAAVAEAVVTRYTTIISELLTNLKKTEDSLKKLKRNNKKNVTQQSNGMSDEDKIRLQLYLDVLQIEKELQKLNMDTNQLNCYEKLLSVVAPYGKVK